MKFGINDIKAGYLLEMDDGRYYIVNYNNRNLLGIGRKNELSENEGYCDLMNFDDDLYCDWRKFKVNKVYGRTFNGFLDYPSPKDRELLWERETYKIGDRFIIKNISVQKMNGNCIKKIDYENIEATLISIYDNIGKLFNLYFDGNSVFVGEEYINELRKVN